MADHFQYLASMGPLALLAAGVAALRMIGPDGARAAVVIGAAFVLGLAAASRRESHHLSRRRDAFPPCPRAQSRRVDGPQKPRQRALAAQDRTADAIGHLEHALKANPAYLEAYNNLGTLLRKSGRPADAVRCFETALRLSPDTAEIRFNLSLALKDLGRAAEARAQYETARRLNPSTPEQVF